MIVNLSIEFYKIILPVVLLASFAIWVLISTKKGTDHTYRNFYLSLFPLITTFLVINGVYGRIYLLKETLVSDYFSRFFTSLILGISLLTVFLFQQSGQRHKFFQGSFLATFLFVVIGMMVALMSHDLMVIFIGIEMFSLGLYVLVSELSPTRSSKEAAIKYFIMGAFTSGFLLMGIAFFYLSYGSLTLFSMNRISELGPHWVVLSMVFLMVGLAFKLALIPFHFWAPDVYEASPSPLIGFMATSVKVVVIGLLIKIGFVFTNNISYEFQRVLIILAVGTLIFGNVLALTQLSLKRMFAYSSIAHSGYLILGLSSINQMTYSEDVIRAVMLYLLIYVLATVGVFAILQMFEQRHASNPQLNDLRGLHKRHPLTAFLLTVLLLSFAGLPPTAGFMAKFFVFKEALRSHLYGSVIIAVLGSVTSLYYYFRPIIAMYFEEEQKNCISLKISRKVLWFVLIIVFLILAGGSVLLPNIYRLVDFPILALRG